MTYTISRNGQQFGPYSRDEVDRYLNEGRLLRTDLAWLPEQQRWAPLSELTPGATSLPPPPATPSHVATAVYVGKKYPYYEAKWAALDTRKSVTSWNWAAFFCGPFWLAYRKLYLYAWGYLGLIVLDSLCQLAFHFDDKVTNPIFWALSAVIGWQGNSLYKRHVEKRVAEIQAIQTPQNAQIEMARQGGTSVGAVVLFTVALIVVSVGFALPEILNKP